MAHKFRYTYNTHYLRFMREVCLLNGAVTWSKQERTDYVAMLLMGQAL